MIFQVQGSDGVWRDAEPMDRAPDPPVREVPVREDVVVGIRCTACGVRKIYLGEGMGYMDQGYALSHAQQCVGRPASTHPSAMDADDLR